jgi:hypothetical protein
MVSIFSTCIPVALVYFSLSGACLRKDGILTLFARSRASIGDGKSTVLTASQDLAASIYAKIGRGSLSLQRPNVALRVLQYWLFAQFPLLHWGQRQYAIASTDAGFFEVEM